MNATFKLVVVHPFGKYSKGDVIYDQSIVNAILDEKNEMHVNENNVRRVRLLPSEMANVSINNELV